jgi:hypothetical protein
MASLNDIRSQVQAIADRSLVILDTKDLANQMLALIDLLKEREPTRNISPPQVS